MKLYRLVGTKKIRAQEEGAREKREEGKRPNTLTSGAGIIILSGRSRERNLSVHRKEFPR